MTGRFLHFYIEPNDDVTYEQVKAKMDLAIDWFKYDQKMWIVYSTSDLSKWKSRLESIAGDSGRYFVCECNPNESVGWMSKSFWEWLKKDRTSE